MEQWRAFFSKAGEDMWTIIEQAILLAAHDHPREFREKRCDIAETLFATVRLRADTDAARQSASVITNCTNQMDASGARDDERASASHTKVQEAMHDSEQHHAEYCSAEAHNDRVDAHVSIPTIVCNIKEILDDSMQPDGAILHGLRKLESLHISVDVLKETEIGKQVNNLRKHPSKEIRMLAKGLVRHWKDVVDHWVSHAGTECHPYREQQTSEQDNVEKERFSTRAHKDTCFLTRVPEEMQQHSHVNGRDSYIGVVEERGSSSRAELAGLDNTENSEKPYLSTRSMADESNLDIDGIARGKSCNAKAFALNRGCGYGFGMISSDESSASKLHGNYGSQRQKQSRVTSDQQVAFMMAIRHEAKLDVGSKRKPYDGHIQMDNAKRQLAAHPNSMEGLSQEVVVGSKMLGQNNHWNQVRK